MGCHRYGASVGFCSTTYEVMLAPSLEGGRSVAAKKEQIEQKETKLTKVFGVPESAPESYKNLRFLRYLLLNPFFNASNRRK